MAKTTRPTRGCNVCGQVDDHPRHVDVNIRHIDCCAAAGCATCKATEAATKGERGPALLKAIQGGALDKVKVP